MAEVNYEYLIMVQNKQRLIASHWTCECLMINCNSNFDVVNKEHDLFGRALKELRNNLDKIETIEKAQFADYQAKNDIDNIYGK